MWYICGFNTRTVFVLFLKEYPLLAPSVRYHQNNGLRLRACVYRTGIVRNELKCGYANIMYTSGSFRPHARTRTHARTHTRTHARTHARTHTRIHTGLKVDSAFFIAETVIFRNWIADFAARTWPFCCCLIRGGASREELLQTERSLRVVTTDLATSLHRLKNLQGVLPGQCSCFQS